MKAVYKPDLLNDVKTGYFLELNFGHPDLAFKEKGN
jgi:hypothetical protein